MAALAALAIVTALAALTALTALAALALAIEPAANWRKSLNFRHGTTLGAFARRGKKPSVPQRRD